MNKDTPAQKKAANQDPDNSMIPIPPEANKLEHTLITESATDTNSDNKDAAQNQIIAMLSRVLLENEMMRKQVGELSAKVDMIGSTVNQVDTIVHKAVEKVVGDKLEKTNERINKLDEKIDNEIRNLKSELGPKLAEEITMKNTAEMKVLVQQSEDKQNAMRDLEKNLIILRPT